MSISYGTVRTHLARIYEKMGATRCVEVVRLALTDNRAGRGRAYTALQVRAVTK